LVDFSSSGFYVPWPQARGAKYQGTKPREKIDGRAKSKGEEQGEALYLASGRCLLVGFFPAVFFFV
jgi:hypothetical protein